MEQFDENKAVKSINKALVDAGRQPYNEDEILNVIDMIWDYYEENGLLDIDDDFDDEDEDIAADLCDYVARMLRKDKGASIVAEDIPIIVDTELAYEDSLIDDIF